MNVVFVSNYFNHHQKPLSDALSSLTGGNYFFIETEKIEEERLALGWNMSEIPTYVRKNYASKAEMAECQRIIDCADVVIIGSAPQYLLKRRIREGRLIIRYSERPLKRGREVHKFIPRLLKWHLQNPPRSNIYMLCASAYTSADYSAFGLFAERMYKWGYFPERKQYDIDALLSLKRENSILWAGRFLDWKHPELAVETAKRLRNDGFSFSLTMIGGGILEEKIQKLIDENDLGGYVRLLGSMTPSQVREYMERSEIFLFTSDRNEGWGAVLNESMNSGCACAASHIIGAVPYLIKSGENGLVYKDGDTDDLYDKVKFLLEHPAERRDMGKRAYKAIANTWNAEIAAERLLCLAEKLLNCENKAVLYADGVCSRAEIIKDKRCDYE